MFSSVRFYFKLFSLGFSLSRYLRIVDCHMELVDKFNQLHMQGLLNVLLDDFYNLSSLSGIDRQAPQTAT